MIYKVYVNYGASYMTTIYGIGYMSVYRGTSEKEYNRVIKEYLGYGGRIEDTRVDKFVTATDITLKEVEKW